MGTNIKGVFQKHTPTKEWVDIDTRYEFNRHYMLFGLLGDVRNGRGFGGIKTGSYITPLAPRRGYPPGFPVTDLDYHDSVYMGEHSHSWFHVREYLLRLQCMDAVERYGVLDEQQYLKWVSEYPTQPRPAPPNPYVDVWGDNIKIIDEGKIGRGGKWTHVNIKWVVDPKKEFSYFTKEIKRLIVKHDTEDIRFVFGFVR